MTIKSCIILSAGLGTRMRPLTDHMPKPMVCVNGRPIIAHIMDMVLAHGVDNIVINIHYKPAALTEYIHTHYAGKVTFSDETDRLLDSGGGIIKALPYIHSDSFFVINADCIWYEHARETTILDGMAEIFDPYKMDIVKCLYPAHKAVGFDEDDIYDLSDVGAIIQKPAKPLYSFTGIQLIKKTVLTGFRPIKFSVREVWEKAFKQNTIYGHVFKGQWLHIGTPDSVLEAEEYLKSV